MAKRGTNEKKFYELVKKTKEMKSSRPKKNLKTALVLVILIGILLNIDFWFILFSF